MDGAKKQLVDKLSSAKNVLVTVSRDPNVDQLAALLGLSLLLNKQGKHSAAVFSGQVPSTLDFLKPEETIERNTDSLRDFIIALDKNKADKLRYKVEDNIVRIFITPYRTSITQDDLDFSQGDFNVDVVVALGVTEQEELDEVVTAHGRILHDATVASINVENESQLGSINWYDKTASSLSELVTELSQSMGENLLDEQIATSLLTGIVAETERFSNDKTTPNTMSMSALLMAAGANQQLVASKLENGYDLPAEIKSTDEPPEQSKEDDGTLKISHDKGGKKKINDQPEEVSEEAVEAVAPEEPAQPIELPEPAIREVKSEPHEESAGTLSAPLPPPTEEADKSPQVKSTPGNRLITEPPTLGGTLTSNAFENALEPSTDPFSLPTEEQPQMLERKAGPLSGGEQQEQVSSSPGDVVAPNSVETDVQQEIATEPPEELQLEKLTPPPFNWSPAQAAETPTPAPPQIDKNDTLAEIEKEFDSPHQYQKDVNDTLSHLEEAVNSPHLKQNGSPPDTDSARDEVNKALSSAPEDTPPSPLASLNAMPLGNDLHTEQPPAGEQPNNGPDNPSGPPPYAPPLPFDFGKPQT